MIQMFLPLGLGAIKDTLLQEVDALAGRRYQHSDSPIKRWGSNPGSVFLGNQKVDIKVPRRRNTDSNKEISLKSYEVLKKMLGFVETSTEKGKVIKELLNGLVENQGLPVDEEILFIIDGTKGPEQGDKISLWKEGGYSTLPVA
jgi:hypothetical protein